MGLLLKNAKIQPHYIKQKIPELVTVDIHIENGKIKAIQSDLTPRKDDDLIDCQGHLILPGLVDPQVHFREPGQTEKEDLESGSRAAARAGFTTVVCMPNTNPTTDTPELIQHIHQRVKEIGLCRVLPTAAVTKGLMGKEISDLKALKAAGAVAFTDDGKGVQDHAIMKEAMSQIAKLKMPILDHSEDESLSRGGSIHAGVVAERHSVPGILPESEAVHVERGCRYAEETGCHFHVLHISTQKSIEHVREAKKKGINVTAEVSPHHLLLCDEDIPTREDGGLDANWKMNPPLRSKEDREACVEALLDGTIDAIATDHAPHTEAEKARPITEAPFGIVGLETAFPLMYTHFVKTGKIPLRELVDMMTYRAAELFSLDYGRLEVGGVADLCLMDLEAEFTISSAEFASKGRNTPFEGQKVFGINKLTVLEGEVVFQHL
jgi:dihydroorotase